MESKHTQFINRLLQAWKHGEGQLPDVSALLEEEREHIVACPVCQERLLALLTDLIPGPDSETYLLALLEQRGLLVEPPSYPVIDSSAFGQVKAGGEAAGARAGVPPARRPNGPYDFDSAQKIVVQPAGGHSEPPAYLPHMRWTRGKSFTAVDPLIIQLGVDFSGDQAATRFKLPESGFWVSLETRWRASRREADMTVTVFTGGSLVEMLSVQLDALQAGVTGSGGQQRAVFRRVKAGSYILQISLPAGGRAQPKTWQVLLAFETADTGTMQENDL